MSNRYGGRVEIDIDPRGNAVFFDANSGRQLPVATLSTDFNGNQSTAYGTSKISLGAQAYIQNQRLLKQQAFLAGVLNVASAWAATTAYTLGQVVQLPTGQHICCTTAGTSGASAPTGNITGRPISDGTVTWYANNWFQTANAQPVQQGSNPTVTAYATVALAQAGVAALGTGVVSNFTQATGPVLNVTSNDALLCNAQATQPWTNGNNGVGAIAFCPSLSSTTQNATQTYNLSKPYGIVNPQGQLVSIPPNSNSFYIGQYDIEFYVTDVVCGIVFNPFGPPGPVPIMILVDDQQLQGSPTQIGTTGLGQTIVINWNGVLKRRKITVCSCTSADNATAYQIYPISILLTAQGKVEATPPSQDVMLALGDSSLVSTLPLVQGQPHQTWFIKRLLGLGGLVNCGVPGTGYIATNAGADFNLLQALQQPANQYILSQFPIRHILVSNGYNDRNTSTQQAIAAAALATWQYIRYLFPLAKITITDGESSASGPDAGAIATAATLLATFNGWADPNSRFIQVVGTGQQTAWIWGTGNVTGALNTGNACELISSDNNHCSLGQAVYYYAQRMAQAITLAWNGDY